MSPGFKRSLNFMVKSHSKCWFFRERTNKTAIMSLEIREATRQVMLCRDHYSVIFNNVIGRFL